MKNNQSDDEFIIGRHPAVVALKADREINKVFIQKELKGDVIAQIIKLARERRLVISRVPKRKLDQMAVGQNHQGVVLAIASYGYVSIDDLFANAAMKNEDPFFLMLDKLVDPHNLGSILRTADAAGVHGIIIPERRAVGLTSMVSKTSSGAIEHVPVVRVTNMVQTARELQRRGLWIFGTDIEGTDYRRWNSLGAVALIIGSEGKGISPLLKKVCDEMLMIPMVGHVQSLNASVAASLLIYQGFSTRHPLD